MLAGTTHTKPTLCLSLKSQSISQSRPKLCLRNHRRTFFSCSLMEEDTWVSCCFDGWRQVFPLVEGNRDVSGCWSLLTLAATILRIERPKRAGGEGGGQARTHARRERERTMRV